MNFEKKNLNCPFRQTLEILGGKWKFAIINSLLDKGVLRFKELERDVEGITARMLVKELKLLEQHGIVSRRAFATIPPTVEYELTECGRSLQPIIAAIHEWGTEHISQLEPTLSNR